MKVILNPFEEISNKLDALELKINAIVKTNPEPPQSLEERFLDTKQVAELFGVSTVSIWKWEKEQFLKSYRIGNLKRFKYTELLESPKLIQRTK